MSKTKYVLVYVYFLKIKIKTTIKNYIFIRNEKSGNEYL